MGDRLATIHVTWAEKWVLLCPFGGAGSTSNTMSPWPSLTSVPSGILIHPAVWQQQTTTTVLRPFVRDHPGEPVPEESFWTLWCKGRLTEADTPAGRRSIRTNQCPSLPSPIFYRPDALPAAQQTASKHWRQLWQQQTWAENWGAVPLWSWVPI